MKPEKIYRLSRLFYLKGFIRISNALNYLNRVIFSCWLPGSCEIGEKPVFGYQGLCLVIHKDCSIGNHVHIDQGVTIGGNGVDFGVPKLESNIYIGAGAKILGPIVVKAGSVIGANAVVINDVEANTVVVGSPARVIKSEIIIDEYLYHLRVNNN